MEKSTTRKRAASKKRTSVKKSGAKKKAPRKWSKKVNETSDALDLERGVFKGSDPKKIAQSLKRSANESSEEKLHHINQPCPCLIFI